MRSYTSFYVLLYCIIILNYISKSHCENFTKTEEASLAPESTPEFPLDFGQVFNEASDVFRKIVSKMVAKKKFLGVNSEWPWS